MNKNIVIIFLGDFQFDARCVNMLNTLLSKKTKVLLYHAGDKNYKNFHSSLLSVVSLSPSKNRFIRYLSWCKLIYKELSSNRVPPAAVVAADLYSLVPVCLYQTSCKIIYDSREIYSELAVHYKSPLKKIIIKLVESFCLKKVSTIITTAPSDQKYLKNIYTQFPNITYEIIYNYPRNIFVNKKTNYLKSRFNISSKKILLLYQGVLQEGRGIKQLFKIIKNLKNSVGIIIGDGEKKADYERFVQHAQLNNQIYFISRVPYMELLEITSSADIGIALIKPVGLSNKFALPNKLFEYAAAGLPCLVSNLPNMKCFVDKYSLGKAVNPYSLSDQIQAINQLKLYDKTLFFPNNSKIKNLFWQSQSETFYKIFLEYDK